MNLWDNFTDSLGITQHGLRDDISKAEKKALENIEASKKNIKTAEQAYTEGRGAAGIAAADKAGIAKKQAMAASKMAGGSKLANAIAGAGAAASASQEGYDQQASKGADLATREGELKANADMQKAQTGYDSAIKRASSKAEENKAWGQIGMAGLSGLGDIGKTTAGAIVSNMIGKRNG